MDTLIISQRLYEQLKNKHLGSITLRNGRDHSVTKYNAIIFGLYPECDNNGNYRLNATVKNFNYFDLRKDGEKAVLTGWPVNKGEHPVNQNGKWKKEGRQSVKVSILFKLLELHLGFIGPNGESFMSTDESPQKIETFKKLFNKIMELFADTLKTVSFSEVQEYDTPSEIFDLGGEGFSSCMKPGSGYGCRHYAELYDLIGCRMAAIVKNNTLYARAILWNVKDDNGNSYVFQDRPYGDIESRRKLIEYAQSKGYLFRTSECSTVVDTDGNSYSVFSFLSDEAVEYMEEEGVPYFDTLYNFYASNPSHLNNAGFGRDVQSSEGRPLKYAYCCASCGDSVDEDYVCWGNDEPYCECCHGDRFTYCDRCDSDIDRENIVHIADEDEWVCEDCAERIAVRCYHCDDFYRNDYYYTAHGNHVCGDCYGRYNYFCCEDCNEHCAENEGYAIEDVGVVCENCYSNNGYFGCCQCGHDYVSDQHNGHECSSYCDACYENIETETNEETEVLNEYA